MVERGVGCPPRAHCPFARDSDASSFASHSEYESSHVQGLSDREYESVY
jgi:hypothetical protein